jgi:uncharacterized cofD-like protein
VTGVQTCALPISIIDADTVIIGPGNFFCSLIPNMIVPGMREALSSTKAKIIYNVNLMSKYGHCNHWTVEDYIQQMNRFIGNEVIDIALYNITPPAKDLIQKYKEEGIPVQRSSNTPVIGKTTLVGYDLIASNIFINPNRKDPLRRTLIRHDSLKLAEALYRIVME